MLRRLNLRHSRRRRKRAAVDGCEKDLTNWERMTRRRERRRWRKSNGKSECKRREETNYAVAREPRETGDVHATTKSMHVAVYKISSEILHFPEWLCVLSVCLNRSSQCGPEFICVYYELGSGKFSKPEWTHARLSLFSTKSQSAHSTNDLAGWRKAARNSEIARCGNNFKITLKKKKKKGAGLLCTYTR